MQVRAALLIACLLVPSLASAQPAPSATEWLTIDAKIVAAIESAQPTPLTDALNRPIVFDLRPIIFSDRYALIVPPQVARERHAKWLHGLILANVFTHGADLASTAWAMGVNDGAGKQVYREANPLAKWATHDPTVMTAYKTVLAGAQVWAFSHIHKTRPKRAAGFLIVSTVLTGIVAHRNAQQIRDR